MSGQYPLHPAVDPAVDDAVGRVLEQLVEALGLSDASLARGDLEWLHAVAIRIQYGGPLTGHARALLRFPDLQFSAAQAFWSAQPPVAAAEAEAAALEEQQALRMAAWRHAGTSQHARRDGLDSIWPSCSAAAPVTRVMHAHRARRLVCVCETGASQGALREPPGEGPGEDREKASLPPGAGPGEGFSARSWTRRSCSRPELDPEVVLPHAELTRSWCSRMRSWREWTGSWTRSWCSACGGGPGAASPHALLPVVTSAFAPHLLRAWRFAARAGRCRNYWRRGRL